MLEHAPSPVAGNHGTSWSAGHRFAHPPPVRNCKRDQVPPPHGEIAGEHALLRNQPDAAVDLDAAGGELAHAQDGAEERRFAHSVRPKHCEELAALEREVKVAPQGRDGGATNLKDHLRGF